MDAAVADTINRMDAARIAKQLDLLDWFAGPGVRWATSIIANTLMGDLPTSNADRAWLVGVLAARTPDVVFDGAPADCDWENFFSHLRTEIESRRNPQTSSVCAAEPPRGMV
jgi:hypothetical protein